MEVYYYCSYTGSPVGFILGRFDYDSQKSGRYELEKSPVSSAIRRYFEFGPVRKAFGFLPEESQYFFLAKKLTAKKIFDGETLNYSLGIALVTNSAEEFRYWMRKESGSEQEIANAIKESIILDRMNDHGFTVCAEQLSELLQKSFRPLFENCGVDLDKLDLDKTYFVLASSRTDLGQLEKELALSDPEKTLWFLNRDTKLACFGKKKRLPLLPIAISLLAAASILMTMAYLLGKKGGASDGYSASLKTGSVYSAFPARADSTSGPLEKFRSQRENQAEAVCMDTVSIPNAVYHIMADGQSTGPFDLALLYQMASAGTFSRNTLVRKSDIDNWMRAGDLLEFQSFFTQNPIAPKSAEI